MGNEFLTTTTRAAKDLAAAQLRRATLEAKASERLARAQQRNDLELTHARQVEADAWRHLMAIPGMTAATAAQIGGTTAIKVSRWVSERTEGTSCN